jgi:hypothetical protein
MRAVTLLIGALLLTPLLLFAGVALGPGNDPTPLVESPKVPTTPGTEAFTVIFSADSLDASEDKVHGTLSIRMSPSAMARMIENRTQQPLAACSGTESDARCTFSAQADSESRTDVLLIDILAYQLPAGATDIKRATSPLFFEHTVRLSDLISAVPNRL